MRNSLLRSGVYSSMRRLPLFFLAFLTIPAQVQQEPVDLAIQQMWQARTEGRRQDAVAARQQARDLLASVPVDSPRYQNAVQQVSQAYQSAGLNAEARSILEEGLARTAPLGNAVQARAGLLTALGESWWQDGNLLKAVGYMEQGTAAQAALPAMRPGPQRAQAARSGIFVSGRISATIGGFNGSVYAYTRLAQLYRQLGRLDAVSGLEAKIRAAADTGALAAFYDQNGQLDKEEEVLRTAAEQGADPQAKSNSWQTLANLEEREQKFKEAVAAEQQAIAALDATPPGTRNQTLWMRQTLARLMGQAGQTAAGDEVFQTLVQEAGTGPQASQMMVSYGQYLVNTGREPQAESLLKNYVDTSSALNGPEKANVLFNLSNMTRGKGDSAQAEAYEKAAQALGPHMNAPPHEGTWIEEQVRAADAALGKHDLDEAFNQTLRAVDTAPQAHDGQQAVWLVMRTADALEAKKQGAKADLLFQRLLNASEAWRSENAQFYLETRQNRAQFLMNHADRAAGVPAALEQYRSALAEMNGPESGTLAEPLRMLLRFSVHPDARTQMDNAARELLEMQASLSGTTSEPYLRELGEVARAYSSSNNGATALGYERKAIALADLLAQANNPWERPQIRMQTAWTLAGLKQFDEAEAMAQQAVDLSPANQKQNMAAQLEQIRQQKRQAAAASHELPGEGLFEIGEQVAPVFDARGDADQPVGDAGLGKFGVGHAGVRGALGVADQGFDAAEGYGVLGYPQAPQKIECGGLAAFKLH